MNRMMVWVLGFLLCTVQVDAQGEAVQRIAFGSCIRQAGPQPIWDAVLEKDPDVFVFMGDNIYADTEDPEVMRREYAALAGEPGFQAVRERCRVFATWDDHDYGMNDGGAEYPMKALSQEIFLDFWGMSGGWSHPGVYHSAIVGPPGREVQFILLDTRYFRSGLVRAQEERPRPFGPYTANPDSGATVLGDAQWAWLEGELRKPAALRLIVSSIQVIPAEHGWEKWANFPAERDRLFGLIASTGANGVVFLSGDRHLAEISRLRKGAYSFYEVTSSALNQVGGGSKEEPNRFRVSESNFRGSNFGLIRIDWEGEPGLELGICDEAGEEVFVQRFGFRELKF